MNHRRRLRNRRLDTTVGKPVFSVGGSNGAVYDIRVPLAPEQIKALSDLIGFIENGEPIPESYYRPSMNRRDDPYLAKEGVMHLHLPRTDRAGKVIYGDELVYLIQYESAVLIVCVAGHDVLGPPMGKNLRNDRIVRKEKEISGALMDAASDEGDGELERVD